MFSKLVLTSLIARTLAHPPSTTLHRRATCTVAGGTSDDTPAILSALKSCNNGGTVLLSGSYTIGSVINVQNLENIQIELTGTLTLNPDITYWTANAVPFTYQTQYSAVVLGGNGIHIYGGGTYHGSGDTWYAKGTSEVRPIMLTICNAQNVVIEDITMLQAPEWHNFVINSSYVTYNNINLHSIQSDGSQAQNTDGWDTYRSSYVTIQNSNIVNGDDCVSFKPNSTSIWVENLICNGSHGISVGSLGQYAGEVDIVTNVTALNISMSNAENGARIKVWPGSPDSNSDSGGGLGYVSDITFQDWTMSAVDAPIVIDQCYESDDSTCAEYPSKLSINDVHYINIGGTGTKNTVVSLVCSAICNDITATGTNLIGKSGVSEFVCENLASTTSLDFPCSSSGVKVTESSSTKSSTTKSSTTKTSSSSTKTTTSSSTKTTTSSSTKTTTTSTKTTTTKTTTTTTQSASTACASLYGQCGGIGFTGATCCASGSACVVQNDYYSQCLAS